MFESIRRRQAGKIVLIAMAGGLLWGAEHSVMAHSGESEALAVQTGVSIVESPLRTEEDRKSDPVRNPQGFLEFARVHPGMRVLDVAAGGGYTAQLLALAVGSEGKVWAQADRLRPGLTDRLSAHPQPNFVAVARPYEDPVPDEAKPLDLVTIILNYHDIAYLPVDRQVMDRRLFQGLKSGGHLLVIDHAAQPGAGTSVARSLHRIEKATVVREFEQAGFRLEAESGFLSNPEDPHTQAYYDMNRLTDRFALRFIKP